MKRCLSVGKVKSGTHYRLDEVSRYRAKTLEVADNAALHAHIDGECPGQPPFGFSVPTVRLRAV